MRTVPVKPAVARLGLLAVAIAIVAGACVGSVERGEFERIVRERGGGLSQDLVIDAVAALEDELGVDALMALSLVATNEVVTLEVVSPEFPDEIDLYTYRGGDLDGPEPVRSAPGVSLPDLELQDPTESVGAAGGTFVLDDVALDQLDVMVDLAIEDAGLRDGYAQNLTITAVGGEGIHIRVQVTNDRRDVTAIFGPGGRLLEVQS